MNDHTMPAGAPAALACHWVRVTDASGRTHMEARWDLPQVATQVATRLAVQAPHAA